jgi:hypothetical protein
MCHWLTEDTVYPGDSVTITFTLQSGTTWKQTWSVAPGAIGIAAGAPATSGTYSFTFGAPPSLIPELNTY